MNAAASGHETVMDGKKVYHIDRLVLLGANILYSDRATYKKTRLISATAAQDALSSEHQPIAAQASPSEESPEPERNDSDSSPLTLLMLSLDDGLDEDELADDELDVEDLETDPETEEEPEPAGEDTDVTDHADNAEVPDASLAASAQEPLTIEPTGESEMTFDAEKLQDQLQGISTSINQLIPLTTTVEAQGKTLADITAELALYREERKNRETELQAAAAATAKEAEKKELIEQIQSSMAETFAKMVNPSGQPNRRTIPISANAPANATATPATEIQLQLAAAQGELRAMEANLQANPSDMIAVQERIHTLNLQLQQG